MAALHDAVFGARRARERACLPPWPGWCDHIEAHLAEALTVDRLAAVAGLSRAHFVRQFTAAVGLPPSDFVAARRMERIERLLLATEMTVARNRRARPDLPMETTWPRCSGATAACHRWNSARPGRRRVRMAMLLPGSDCNQARCGRHCAAARVYSVTSAGMGLARQIPRLADRRAISACAAGRFNRPNPSSTGT